MNLTLPSLYTATESFQRTIDGMYLTLINMPMEALFAAMIIFIVFTIIHIIFPGDR